MSDVATYTFEAPEFTIRQTTPLLNMPPNTGPATFLTSFTDSVDVNGFTISNFLGNNLMVGQALLEPLGFTSALTLTFNTPVTGFSVDFAIDTGFPPGSLKLVTSSFILSIPGSNVGGRFRAAH
jgi:hypothetical protein